MQHHGFVPSALEHAPRPTEREILVKLPSSAHNERPRTNGGDNLG